MHMYMSLSLSQHLCRIDCRPALYVITSMYLCQYVYTNTHTHTLQSLSHTHSLSHKCILQSHLHDRLECCPALRAKAPSHHTTESIC